MKNFKTFIATCVDIVDTAGIFRDATELAQMIETGKKISAKEFLNNCKIIPTHKKIKNKSYAYNPDYDIYWFYDKKKDIHYLYG